jgi:hypothetical protein
MLMIDYLEVCLDKEERFWKAAESDNLDEATQFGQFFDHMAADMRSKRAIIARYRFATDQSHQNPDDAYSRGFFSAVEANVQDLVAMYEGSPEFQPGWLLPQEETR